ncbi:HAMP domain-containing sensor histidine kinase [Sphingomonas sp. H39-1-10]|uniref:sensor histidine kinase n=1 Tax=Sphingomonas pollutisoli TaxID=3030829 RepID=UPI0023B8B4F2|nr:HAMP domain-containing sensor histidine kinase [Sphingomonas pollutisoli]MDF0486548.1 HAMP domain-containing sensor histidine kinase [Sphingomonas pollutisoli]
MRLLPRSLAGRLLATAAVTILIALALAAAAIGHVLERFVMSGLDDRLDAQIAIVARAVGPDGTLDPAKAIDLPPFDQPGSGWAWEVIGPGATLRSASLNGTNLPLPPTPDDRFGPERREHIPERPHPLEGVDAGGQRIHYRIAHVPTLRGDALVLAAGPRAIVDRPIRAAMVPLLLSVLLLGGFLAVALVVQLRIGLRPLAKLRDRVAEVRTGRVRHITVEEPTELLPLVSELNALIDANETAVARARGHVANLAHGLKTPLATLKLDLAEGDGRLREQVERMERQIRHHLGRARAAEPGAAAARVELTPHLNDLIAAMARIHADRDITPLVDLAPALEVRCDAQDLDEMLGNLLDNAWRHARTQVRISTRVTDRMVRIDIADDGSGMTPAQIAEITRGHRLDERGEGHGFGLAISRELAELHGGTLELGASADGGLAVVLNLPGAV